MEMQNYGKDVIHPACEWDSFWRDEQTNKQWVALLLTEVLYVCDSDEKIWAGESLEETAGK